MSTIHPEASRIPTPEPERRPPAQEIRKGFEYLLGALDKLRKQLSEADYALDGLRSEVKRIQEAADDLANEVDSLCGVLEEYQPQE